MDPLNIFFPSQSVQYDSITDIYQLVQELHDVVYKSQKEERPDLSIVLLCEDVSLNDLISIFFRTGREDGLSQIETRCNTIMNEG